MQISATMEVAFLGSRQMGEDKEKIERDRGTARNIAVDTASS